MGPSVFQVRKETANPRDGSYVISFETSEILLWTLPPVSPLDGGTLQCFHAADTPVLRSHWRSTPLLLLFCLWTPSADLWWR